MLHAKVYVIPTGCTYMHEFDIYAIHDLEFEYRIRWAKRIAKSYGYEACVIVQQW